MTPSEVVALSDGREWSYDASRGDHKWWAEISPTITLKYVFPKLTPNIALTAADHRKIADVLDPPAAASLSDTPPTDSVLRFSEANEKYVRLWIDASVAQGKDHASLLAEAKAGAKDDPDSAIRIFWHTAVSLLSDSSAPPTPEPVAFLFQHSELGHVVAHADPSTIAQFRLLPRWHEVGPLYLGIARPFDPDCLTPNEAGAYLLGKKSTPVPASPTPARQQFDAIMAELPRSTCLHGTPFSDLCAECVKSDEFDPLNVLDFCAGAIEDAIGLEDGLDGEAGSRVLSMIRTAKARAALPASPAAPPTLDTHESHYLTTTTDAELVRDAERHALMKLADWLDVEISSVPVGSWVRKYCAKEYPSLPASAEQPK